MKTILPTAFIIIILHFAKSNVDQKNVADETAAKGATPKTFFYEAPHLCTQIVVIQYNTRKLADTSTVNPHRSLMVVDCTGQTDFFAKTQRLAASLPFTRTLFADIGQNCTFDAILIEAEHLKPHIAFTINEQHLTVLPENSDYAVYISYGPWRNCEYKSDIKFSPGVFHFTAADFEHNFRVFSHILPFTQTYLLQIANLGSVNARAEIGAFERGLSSAFVDLNWCSRNRSCNGGTFEVPDWAQQGDAVENLYGVAKYINHLFANVHFQSSGPKQNKETRNTVRLLTLVNDIAQYDAGSLNKSRRYAVNPQEAVYLVTTADDLKLNVSGEVPLELGNKYNLKKDANPNSYADMARSFSLGYEHNVVLPYFVNSSYPLEMKRGAMNHVRADETDLLFASFSDYSLNKMVGIYNKPDTALFVNTIDGAIKFKSSVCREAHYVTTVICSVRGQMDLEVFRINVHIPSVVSPDYWRGNIMVVGFDRFDSITNVLKYKMASQLNLIVALPENFYPESGYLKITNHFSNTTKKYFVRDDAMGAKFPNVVKGFR